MQLSVKNATGEVTGTAEVSDAVFAVPMNMAVVHQALVMYQLNKRQGTHSTKTRAQVSGGGRKPWRQKHTGRARQGSIRSPQWRHGGVVFGPHPRDHRVDLPRKMRNLALKCVLSEKVRQDNLVLLDGFGLGGASTRAMKEVLGKLGVGGSALLITEAPERSVVLSARNLKKIWTLPVSLINADELLKRDAVIMTLDAARKAETLWAAATGKGRGPDKAATEGDDDGAEAQ